MPLKPNGALCSIREQIVEDLASGLVLQFECSNGHSRLVIAGDALFVPKGVSVGWESTDRVAKFYVVQAVRD